MDSARRIEQSIVDVTGKWVAPLDLLPEGNLAERLIGLRLGGIPEHIPPAIQSLFQNCLEQIDAAPVDDLRVVVFGGGTGLSNIIGGDSRRIDWPQAPFTGLKEIFPRCHSIVCITDDGGSTGELLKDLPLIALGDLRHVLLASMTEQGVQQEYDLDQAGAMALASGLHKLFNYRFITRPDTARQLLGDTDIDPAVFPSILFDYFKGLITRLFTDKRLRPCLGRPQCLGNLLLAAAIYGQFDPNTSRSELAADHQRVCDATIKGLSELCQRLGMHRQAVLPCTTTNAQLQIRYTNGVQVTGEHKSSLCQRHYPVDRVLVEFFRTPYSQPEVIHLIQDAHILIFAPGSLYTSIIPIMQTPGIAEAIRANEQALKLLVTNIWVQKGETDVSRDAPDRKFYVSDLIRAYHHNIPGGVNRLFSHVLSLDLADIPGSVLQRYAIEDKQPIYLDRKKVRDLGFGTVAVPLFSRDLLASRQIIQHDPSALALSVRVLHGLWHAGRLKARYAPGQLPKPGPVAPVMHHHHLLPCLRYDAIVKHCSNLGAELITSPSHLQQQLKGKKRHWLMGRVIEIIWNHPDILIEHLQYIRGISMVDPACWNRCQQWDNVFSFYDPADQRIKIRRDQTEDLNRFEMAFLVALGQSLLGNYADSKQLETLMSKGEEVGRLFTLTIKEPDRLTSFFDNSGLETYLTLARMRRSAENSQVFTRVINGNEGFTPPGLLFGLCYAWYLDNCFATNIEYKMSVLQHELGDLIPEQARLFMRRKQLICFFRNQVFLHS